MRHFFQGKIVLFLLLLLAIGISGILVAGSFMKQEGVRVPNLVGRDAAAADEIMQRHELQVLVDHKEPHASIPRNAVIFQSPVAGSVVARGQQIRVTLSQGPSEMIAPDLVGKYFREAELKIQEAGFVPAEGARASSDTVERGYVIAQSPSAGSLISKGGAISLLVSSGKRNRMLIMPKLIGLRVDQAIQELDTLELAYQVQESASNDKAAGPAGTVLSQSPKPGYPVAFDATVDLETNK